MPEENKKELWVKFYRSERSLEFIKNCDKERAWQKIMHKHNLRRLRTISLRIGSCAACIGLIAGLFYFSFFRDMPMPDDTSLAVLQKVYPEKGSNKAILTLDNGEVVDLGSHQGAISESVKNVDGEQLVYNNSQTDKMQYNTLTIPRGGEYQLVLSDGTRIWMNADSKLHYPVAFMGSTREITLEGEAYFEVAHDETHPFKVHTSLGTIEVLGTTFNISAYPENSTSATLVSGKVSVSTRLSKATLIPGQQAILTIDSKIETRTVDTAFITSWRTGTYLFQDMPLRDILAQLSRWYNVDIHFQSPELEDIRFTGGILRNEELAFAVSVISEVSNVQFVRKGDVIWIKSKG